MSKPLIRQLIHQLKELPLKEEGKPNAFWDTLESDDFKLLVNMLMVNELVGCDATTMTDDQCRGTLGKLCAYRDLLLSPDDLWNRTKESKEEPAKNPLDLI